MANFTKADSLSIKTEVVDPSSSEGDSALDISSKWPLVIVTILVLIISIWILSKILSIALMILGLNALWNLATRKI